MRTPGTGTLDIVAQDRNNVIMYHIPGSRYYTKLFIAYKKVTLILT